MNNIDKAILEKICKKDFDDLRLKAYLCFSNGIGIEETSNIIGIDEEATTKLHNTLKPALEFKMNNEKAVRTLLQRIGINRKPFNNEFEQYDAWIKAGFTLNDLLEMCDNINAPYPSFKYLNTIVGSVSEARIEGESISKSLKRSQDFFIAKKGIFNNLKQGNNIYSKELLHKAFFKYDTAPVLALSFFVGMYCNRYAEFERLLKNLMDNDVAINDFITKYSQSAIKAKTIFSEFAYNNATLEDVKKIYELSNTMDKDLLNKAYLCSVGKSFNYFLAVCKKWNDNGIKTVEEADKFVENTFKDKTNKKLIHQNYTQRTYEEEDYNVYIPNFEKKE